MSHLLSRLLKGASAGALLLAGGCTIHVREAGQGPKAAAAPAATVPSSCGKPEKCGKPSSGAGQFHREVHGRAAFHFTVPVCASIGPTKTPDHFVGQRKEPRRGAHPEVERNGAHPEVGGKKPPTSAPSPTDTPATEHHTVVLSGMRRAPTGSTTPVPPSAPPSPAIPVPPPAEPPKNDFGYDFPVKHCFEGQVFPLAENTNRLPSSYEGLEAKSVLYACEWDIAPRSWEQGFPGIPDRFEWFAIRYQGKFHVQSAGSYQFRLASDDGAKLTVDGRLVVDNDEAHPPRSAQGGIELSAGDHFLVLEYFQGPRYELNLQLFVTPPGGQEGLFSVRD